MGIIQKQAIKGTIYSYLGVLIGFITTGLLFPRILTTDENGLLKLLISYSLIFAQFASLGFNSVTTRLFTYFRDHKNSHHGFLFIAFIVGLGGFIIIIIAFFLLKPLIISNSIDKSALFVEYLYYIIPLIFFTLFFSILDNYYKVLYNAVRGTFLKEFLQRLLILFSVILYYFNLLNFNFFVIAYITAICLPTIFISISLILEKQFSLKPDFSYLSKEMSRTMISVSVYGILISFSGILILNIDSIMINSMIGISQTGIYAITFFFGTIILIPSRSLTKISAAVIADAWKEKNLILIKDIYYKSCLNQLIFAGLLFIGIWANINNIFKILPPEYEPGKYVIFFIGISSLIQMASGISNIVIFNSKYYKVHTYFMLILVVLIITTNLIFIPKYGIVGAAMASALSNLVFNLLKFIFLYFKFRMQPFDRKYFIIIIAAGLSYIIGYLLPEIKNYIFDIIIRSAIIALIYGSFILIFKVSDELNQKFFQIFKFIKK